MNKYKTIHDRKKRGGREKRSLSEKALLEKAQKLFNSVSKEKIVRDLAKSFGNMTLRVDLVGTPEVSFIIAVQNRKLKFVTDKLYTDMAIGIHKEYFLELVKNPPELGNMNIIYNNIIFRKGVVKMFKRSRPLFSSALLSGIEKKQ